MVTSPYECKILEWDDKLQKKKKQTKEFISPFLQVNNTFKKILDLKVLE